MDACRCLLGFVLNCWDAGFKLRVAVVTGSMTGARNCSIDLKLITRHLRSFGFYQHSPSCQSEIGVLVIQNQDDDDRCWKNHDYDQLMMMARSMKVNIN